MALKQPPKVMAGLDAAIEQLGGRVLFAWIVFKGDNDPRRRKIWPIV